MKKLDKKEIVVAFCLKISEALIAAFPDYDFRLESDGEVIIVNVDMEDEEKC